MGGCGCPEPETCGCFFAATSDIVPTGTGSKDNPMLLAIAPGKKLWLVGASDDLPDVPQAGQPVWEEDTGLLVVWDSALGEWRPLSTGGIQAFTEVGSNTSPNAVGSNDVASLTIPDQGWPYLVIASASLFLTGGQGGDLYNVTLTGAGFTVGAEIAMTQSGVPGSTPRGFACTGMGFAVRSGASTMTLSYVEGVVAGPVAEAPGGSTLITALVIPV